jgi:membrane fusion protein, heavy metal efflux system
MHSNSTNKVLALLAIATLISGCTKIKAASAADEAPPPAKIVHDGDVSIFHADRPELFKLTTAGEHRATVDLQATGVVSADISRTVPVVSLASGRVVEVRAKLGEQVRKGQLLLRIRSTDVSGAFSDYQKAAADEKLARAQVERAELLYSKGAIAFQDLEVARNAENKAKVDVETTSERLRVLGANDLNSATGVVNVYAPVSGYIIEQNVTNAGGVKSLDNSPNLFTIADLSHVWIICDVFENDLGSVQLGNVADVRLNAFPDQVLHGRISDIGPVLDPNLRTAKVRLELPNPGSMRVGMFVNATFHGKRPETNATVPATAVLHLHDRDWVYIPDGNSQFRRTPVVSGAMLQDGLQEITSGLKPGQQVVTNALELQTTVEQ